MVVNPFLICRCSEGANEPFGHLAVTFNHFSGCGIIFKILTGRYFQKIFSQAVILSRIFPRRLFSILPDGLFFYHMVNQNNYRFKTNRGMTGYSYRSVQPVGRRKTCIFRCQTILLIRFQKLKWFPIFRCFQDFSRLLYLLQLNQPSRRQPRSKTFILSW